MRYIKYIANIMLLCFIVFGCIGCSNAEISQKEYNYLLAQNKELKTQLDKYLEKYNTTLEQYNQLVSENTQLKKTLNAYEEATIPTKVVGGFSATVRDIIPDYCFNNTTPQVAVVTCFQDGPFTISIGEERAKVLTIGETYYFEFKATEIGRLTETEFNNGSADPQEVLKKYGVPIEMIRLAKEDELGLESLKVRFEVVDNY